MKYDLVKESLNINMAEELSLNEILIRLSAYGAPHIGVYGSKTKSEWHAHIDMNVPVKGSSYAICSEYNHSTPIEAVKCLIKRIIETLKQF